MTTQKSPEYRRKMVFAYMDLPHGEKADWLDDNNLTDTQIRRWKKKMQHGTLDLTPPPRRRNGTPMTNDNYEMKRLRNQIEQLTAEKEELTRRAERAEQDADAFKKGMDYLGKAIDSLQPRTDN